MACWDTSQLTPTKRHTRRHLVGSCCVTPVNPFAWEPSWEPFAVDLCGRLWTPEESKASRSGLNGRLWTPVDTACRSTDQEVGGSSPSGCTATLAKPKLLNSFGFAKTVPRKPCVCRVFFFGGTWKPEVSWLGDTSRRTASAPDEARPSPDRLPGSVRIVLC